MDKKEFEQLCNDFNNVGHLLTVMSRSSAEQSAWLDTDTLKKYHQEMSYSLDFIANALKIKCNIFWSLLEDIAEN